MSWRVQECGATKKKMKMHISSVSNRFNHFLFEASLRGKSSAHHHQDATMAHARESGWTKLYRELTKSEKQTSWVMCFLVNRGPLSGEAFISERLHWD
jgi:hypothetical protein